MAAAIVLAIRDSGARRGGRGDRFSVGVHDLDEPERMEGRRAHDLCRLRQLYPAAQRSPLRGIGRAYPGLYDAVGAAPAAVRDLRRRGVSCQFPWPWRAARD